MPKNGFRVFKGGGEKMVSFGGFYLCKLQKKIYFANLVFN